MILLDNYGPTISNKAFEISLISQFENLQNPARKNKTQQRLKPCGKILDPEMLEPP